MPEKRSEQLSMKLLLIKNLKIFSLPNVNLHLTSTKGKLQNCMTALTNSHFMPL
jgi:hypothetical protein